MKPFSFFLLGVFVLTFWGCEDATTPAGAPDGVSNFPNDDFFLRRMNPDGTYDWRAYEKALMATRDQLHERGDEPGFDLDWVVQGPGNIGARINTIAVNPVDEDIIFVGFSHGGVWRTKDGGAHWEPVFDDEIYPSISDIVFDPTNPSIVYVGTGDLNIPFNAFIGNGLYKSSDGGDSWELLGLTDQRIISKIIVDPENPNTIYAAAMGIPMAKNQDRGVYKTTDGGQTWTQVLFVSEQAGVIDMVMDPFDPQTLYAAGWDRHRTNKVSIVSGPGGRIFKTTDGGANWVMLEGGLPILDKMGRTGLAISQKTPGLVFSVFVGANSQLYGIYRSEDAGAHWSEVPTDEDLTGLSGNALGGFGWYFGKIFVHPDNDDLLFLCGVDLWMGHDSIWEPATPPWWEYSVHADKHDIAFTPSGNMYLATDGGLYKTSDLGATWSDPENIPTTQFYRVAYNPHRPDLYYGGAQDNGTTGGNAQMINDWPRIFGGDGFQPAFHPDNPDVFYVETQNGNISVTQNGGLSFAPADNGIPFSDARNWDMPYMISGHWPDRLLAGTDRVYVSHSGVVPLFKAVSPNLTEFDDSTTTRNHNISTLHESPLDSNLVYAGTADGRVWRSDTLLSGNWEEISADLPDRYVTSVKASPTFLDWVYVVQSGYRDNEFIPRVHRSKNRGETWEDISANLPDLAVNDIYVLPEHQDSVLFVANDGGVYGTIDGGASWHRVGKNMPLVPVYDLEWNVAKNEIVAGTFARSIMSYALDSLLFPQEPVDTTTAVTQAIQKKPTLRVYPSPASQYVEVAFNNTEPGRDAHLAILDESGRLVSEKTVSGFGENIIRFNVSNWFSGVYVVKIKIRHQVLTGRFVKI